MEGLIKVFCGWNGVIKCLESLITQYQSWEMDGYAQKAWREASQAHYNFDIVKGQDGQYCDKDYETKI